MSSLRLFQPAHARDWRVAAATMFVTLCLCGTLRASEVELKSACADNADAESSDICRYYVTGYLEGALLTDPAIVRSLRAPDDSSEFFDRAYRTRVGVARDPSPTYLAGFCLPVNGDVETVAAEVREHLAATPDASAPVREAVHRAITSLYPCEGPGS